MIEVFLSAVVSGVVSATIVILTLKIDVKWIKELLENHDERITFLERNT
jgi:hypothetical protein